MQISRGNWGLLTVKSYLKTGTFSDYAGFGVFVCFAVVRFGLLLYSPS